MNDWKKQKITLKQIFEKPERSDIVWNKIESLFKALGAEITDKGAVKSVQKFLIETGVNYDGI